MILLLALALLACQGTPSTSLENPEDTQDTDCTEGCPDADGDGWDAPEDCDDEDSAVNPGASELCGSGVDEDCDGLLDCEDADCAAACTEDCESTGDEDGDGYADCMDEECWGVADCGQPEVQVTGGHLSVLRAHYAYYGGGDERFHYANFFPTGHIQQGSQSCQWSGRFFASATWSSALAVDSMARVSSSVSTSCGIELGEDWMPPLSQMTWESSSVHRNNQPWYVVGERYGSVTSTWKIDQPYTSGRGTITSFYRPLMSGSPFSLE